MATALAHKPGNSRGRSQAALRPLAIGRLSFLPRGAWSATIVSDVSPPPFAHWPHGSERHRQALPLFGPAC